MAYMDTLTGKEKECIVNYTEDLLKLLDEEKGAMVSDGKNSYDAKEITTIKEKVLNL